ncbi:hypothetical protein [Altericista sp. CCNU0014]|uniref:hypothetical protein n=1 Tax=Altericista sp. CCNU0014 TaxID=3082949 RepID=UPI003850A9EE
MGADWQNLRLSAREIEQWSGLEVSDRWIGGLLLGVYRFSKLQRPLDWMGWLLFELVTVALLFVFTLPIGLGVLRIVPSTRAMLASMGVATMGGMVALYGHRARKGRSLQTLLHLLDEIDRYHRVLEAIAVVDRLAVAQGKALPIEHQETLQLTRDCLVTGLKTERILREQNNLMGQDGVAHLEQSLVLLKTLDLQTQADEYAGILQQSLAIAERVQQELYGTGKGHQSPTD